ncbi:MAG: PrsW family intramembrane metalloprotease [Bacteroidales bacterium]|nr:PrsW family intramembrane metalloprotease [Bacteroidales bacterium]
MIELTIIALLPIFVILAFVYFRDPDKEPPKTLFTAFFFGVLTIIPAALWEEFVCNFFLAEEYPFINNFFCIALTEEVVKLAVIILYVFRHKDFNDTFDGIVYAVAVSLGFAAAENIMYTLESGLDTGIMRAFTSVPGHAAFAVFMGYLIPRAKTNHFYMRTQKRNKYILLSLLIPTVIHGMYDYLLTIKEVGLFLVLIICIDIAAIIIINKARKNDRSIMIDTEEMTDNQINIAK